MQIYRLFRGSTYKLEEQGAKTVALSSSEAEYVALSEAAKEIKFVYQVLFSMDFKVKLPIIVHVDNLGTIFMSENVSVSHRTKHVDIRYRFVQEFVLDGFIKIIFVRTSNNDADIFTKNLGRDLYDCHSKKMVIEKGKIRKKTSHSTWKGVTRCCLSVVYNC